MGRMDGCFTAYLTAYSTFDRTIALRAVPSKRPGVKLHNLPEHLPVLAGAFAGKYNLLHIHAPRRLLRGGAVYSKRSLWGQPHGRLCEEEQHMKTSVGCVSGLLYGGKHGQHSVRGGRSARLGRAARRGRPG